MGVKTALETVASKLNTRRMPAPGRRLRRGREKRFKHAVTLDRSSLTATVPLVEPSPDPVGIAVLAMESLGRASMRASFTGTEVQVAVPDARTAAIFEAAIAETAHRRSTDRLIRIVIG
jgi:hypothetical protein